MEGETTGQGFVEEAGGRADPVGTERYFGARRTAVGRGGPVDDTER